jgi:plastocyanin
MRNGVQTMVVDKRPISLAAGVALLMLAGACAKSASPAANSPSPSQSTSSAGGRYGGGGYGGGSSPSVAPLTVNQGAGGFVFAPSTLTVKKGQSITVTNVGSAPHTFTITGKGIDVVNSPGQSQSVTINLAPGTYQFICRFHVNLGMKGTLNVTG